MHFHVADQFIAADSPVHHLDPRVKASLTLLFILTAALTPAGEFWAYGILLIFILATAILARVGLLYVIKRSFIALPFALAAVSLPFTIPGETLFTLPIFGGLSASVEGVIRFASVLAKSWVSVQAAIVLVAVTPFPELLWGLRALHVPEVLVGIMAIMYRYLFVLSDEALRMIRARASRSAGARDHRPGRSLAWRGKVAGRMAGSLMLRSFERSERIYSAMLSRGYQGQILTLSQYKMRRIDFLALTAGLSFCALILIIANLINT